LLSELRTVSVPKAYGGGTAMEVLAIGLALAVVALVWGLFKVLAPSGWRRMDARDVQ